MRSRFFVCALALAAACTESDPESPPFPGSTGEPNVGTTAAPTTGGTTAGTTSSTTGATTGGTTSPTTGATGTTGSVTPTTTGGTPTTTGGMTTTGGAMGTTGSDGGQTTPPVDGGGMMADTGTSEPQTCPGGGAGPGRTNETVQVGGVNRDYILYVPRSYTGDTPVPLMVNFHPLLTNARTAEGSSGYKELADKEGFIVAFPDGQADQAWNVAGVCCTRDSSIDDIGFARALVEQVKSKLCVDNKRVYASGFSMGAGMAQFTACQAADVFAAATSGHFDLFKEYECNPSRPITVYNFRSESDFIVPYEGGEKTSAPNGFRGMHTFEGAVGNMERWAGINGCTGSPVDSGSGCQTYEECSDGVKVTLCTVGGGHNFPDAQRSWDGIKDFTLP